MNAPLPEAARRGQTLSDHALRQLFLDARTFNRFTDRPVDDATLRDLVQLLRWGPTAMNTQPGRYVFVRSAEAKQRLKPALSPGNVDKTMVAPVTVIVGEVPTLPNQSVALAWKVCVPLSAAVKV